MVTLTPEYYTAIVAETRKIVAHTGYFTYEKITEDSLNNINRVLDFVHTARFVGFKFKPMRGPNPYYFIRNHSNNAYCVRVILTFEYKNRVVSIPVKGKHGGLETLVKDVCSFLKMPKFGKDYMSAEGVMKTHFFNNSCICKDPALKVLHWPSYIDMFNRNGEANTVKSILDEYGAKNTYISSGHEKALLKIDPIIEYEEFLSLYGKVVSLMNEIRDRGVGPNNIESMMRVASQYSHEEALLSPDNIQLLINQRVVQNVHK